ncbi:MAG TPA: hypothetical protein PLD94_13535 [Ornithinibacter sp.]|nr:hypothetical protein [Ornithinibacter sp.]
MTFRPQVLAHEPPVRQHLDRGLQPRPAAAGPTQGGGREFTVGGGQQLKGAPSRLVDPSQHRGKQGLGVRGHREVVHGSEQPHPSSPLQDAAAPQFVDEKAHQPRRPAAQGVGQRRHAVGWGTAQDARELRGHL